jgi:hypothetical protein
MLDRLAELPRSVHILMICTGISWLLSAIFWRWQRYYLLKLFRSSSWRGAKTRTKEIALHEKVARRAARSQTFRIITAAVGIAVIALGILGLSLKN